jgi:hypothetical protein
MLEYNITELQNDFEIYHSNFQIDNMITSRDGITPYGCYKQALREFFKRVGIYRECICNNKMLELNIKKLERAISDETDDIEKEMLKVELVRKQLKVPESEQNLKEVERELTQFYKHSVYLKKLLEEEHGELTGEKKTQLEQDFWKHKFIYQSAMETMTLGKPGESIKLLEVFPVEMQTELIKKWSPQNCVNWLQKDYKKIELNPKELNKIELNIPDLNLIELS